MILEMCKLNMFLLYASPCIQLYKDQSSYRLSVFNVKNYFYTVFSTQTIWIILSHFSNGILTRHNVISVHPLNSPHFIFILLWLSTLLLYTLSPLRITHSCMDVKLFREGLQNLIYRIWTAAFHSSARLFSVQSTWDFNCTRLYHIYLYWLILLGWTPVV